MNYNNYDPNGYPPLSSDSNPLGGLYNFGKPKSEDPQPKIEDQDGRVSFVNSFEELRQKKFKPNAQYNYWEKIDPSNESQETRIYLVATDDKGTPTFKTYSVTEIPNPVPVTKSEAAQLESRLMDNFSKRFEVLEKCVSNIGAAMEKIAAQVSNIGANRNELSSELPKSE